MATIEPCVGAILLTVMVVPVTWTALRFCAFCTDVPVAASLLAAELFGVELVGADVVPVAVESPAKAGADNAAAMQKASRAGLRSRVVEVSRVMGCPKVVVG
ncbi:hypothetical protein GCM10027065_16170 [Rhodanobacter koreensis]